MAKSDIIDAYDLKNIALSVNAEKINRKNQLVKEQISNLFVRMLEAAKRGEYSIDIGEEEVELWVETDCEVSMGTRARLSERGVDVRDIKNVNANGVVIVPGSTLSWGSAWAPSAIKQNA